jgi:lipopolysaccharide transport system ATP-binding protein
MASATLAIKTEGLSKRYPLGTTTVGYATLGESVANFVRRRNRPKRVPHVLWALRDITIEVQQGETVAFIGRNGAGKSTLLKVLSRITQPTEGHATLHGRVASLLEVGTGFHGELTGRENVYLNGALLGLTRREIDQRFDEIVAFSEVEEFLDTPVKRYSSGMTVRLAFSVAAHLEPEILLVDEVLAVGDLAFQRKCLGKMTEVASTGRTVIFVSHNMAVIQALCRRGIYLEHGAVQTDGPVEAAVADYLRALEAKAEALDLSERTDRRGSQDIRLRRIDIQGPGGSATVTTGAPAAFSFGLTGMARGLSCVFRIYDQLGHPVTEVSSVRSAPQDVFEHQDEPHFDCQIEELLLLPGRYRLDVSVFGGGELQDKVEGAAYFDVVDGIVRGRPISLGESAGHIVLPARWTGPESGVA